MRCSLIALAGFLAGCSTILEPARSTYITPNDHQLETVAKIPELMASFGVSGLAVTAVSQDQVVVQRGFGRTADGRPFTAETSCGLFSATKVLASLVYTSLEEQGKLNLRAPLGSYLEDAPASWKDIPFFRLLNHTSGIPMVVNKDEFAKVASDPLSTNRTLYELVRDEPLDYEPGSVSRYRQSGYAVGEMILREKLGSDFADLVSTAITQPAGMTATFHPAIEDDTQASLIMSAGGYETTAADMSRLFLALNSGALMPPQTVKDTLLQDAYLMGDYSLGSVIEYANGILTIGHSGGGARANLRYAPDAGIGVMICTDDRSNAGLAMPLARMLIQEIVTDDTPQLPLLVVAPRYADMSADEVIASIDAAQEMENRYDLDDIEPFMNEVGYTFLAQERHDEAVKILTYNAEKFPNSPNVHHSLGEALLAAGELEEALIRYRIVLRLDPENENAKKMIEKIRLRRATPAS
ncbi:serine hydrolase [Erythrobacter sp. HA6-11]